MSRRNLIILLVVTVIVIVIIIVGLSRERGPARVGEEVRGPDPFRPENLEALPTVEGGTREILKEVVATPELNATSVPQNVAVPKSVVRIGGDEGILDRRTFEIKAEGGKYIPDTIVVNDLDVVEVTFTAVDAPYDIFIPDFGVLAIAKQGETIKTQFQATPFGEYKFFCKNCAQKVEGTLIVNQK